MDLLDFTVDGVLIRKTDLTQFKTELALKDWRKRVKTVFKTIMVDPTPDKECDFYDAMDEFVEPYRDHLREASQQRKLSMPARNLELIVRRGEYDYPAIMNEMTAEQVGKSLHLFEDAEHMTSYEFDSYDTLGEQECDNQAIETLYDMFGTEFAVAFYRRKNILILNYDLSDLLQERAEIDNKIADLQNKISDLN